LMRRFRLVKRGRTLPHQSGDLTLSGTNPVSSFEAFRILRVTSVDGVSR